MSACPSWSSASAAPPARWRASRSRWLRPFQRHRPGRHAAVQSARLLHHGDHRADACPHQLVRRGQTDLVHNRLLFGVGFCGAFATLSALVLEISTMVQRDDLGVAFAYLATTLVGGWHVPGP